MERIEMISSFTEEGKIIPRRFRIYDIFSGEYLDYSVKEIFYYTENIKTIEFRISAKEEKSLKTLDALVIYDIRNRFWKIKNLPL